MFAHLLQALLMDMFHVSFKSKNQSHILFIFCWMLLVGKQKKKEDKLIQ